MEGSNVFNAFNFSGASVLPDNTSTNIVAGHPRNVNHAIDLNSFFQYPPAINRPEFYYGFAGVTLAWQVMFLVIASDPVRYRTAMLPAVLEKAGFAIAVPVLYAADRGAGGSRGAQPNTGIPGENLS